MYRVNALNIDNGNKSKFVRFYPYVMHVRRSNKCVSSELVCDGEADCPKSDDENECIGLIAPARKKYVKYVRTTFKELRARLFETCPRFFVLISFVNVSIIAGTFSTDVHPT